MSDPVVIPGEPETTIIDPDTTIVEANPTIIVEAPEVPEPEPEPVPVVAHQCITVDQFEEVMRRVMAEQASEPEPEPEPEPTPPPEPDTAPEPSHPFFRKRGGSK